MMEPVEKRRVLWLLRHAKAEAGPPSGGSDQDRHLASRGRRDAAALGRRLGREGDHLGLEGIPLPSVVLCSKSTRTVETARRATAHMSETPELDLRGSMYGADADEVLAEVRAVDDGVVSVMVIGHNPALEEVVFSVGGQPDPSLRGARRAFPTCALAVFEVSANRWRDLELGSVAPLGLFFPPY